MRRLLCRSGGTLSVDRAWMEELLMNELDTRWPFHHSQHVPLAARLTTEGAEVLLQV